MYPPSSTSNAYVDLAMYGPPLSHHQTTFLSGPEFHVIDHSNKRVIFCKSVQKNDPLQIQFLKPSTAAPLDQSLRIVSDQRVFGYCTHATTISREEMCF